MLVGNWIFKLGFRFFVLGFFGLCYIIIFEVEYLNFYQVLLCFGCQVVIYSVNFDFVGGFDMEVKGWGGEDVYFYRKYLYGDLIVIRILVFGFFYFWYEKRCVDELTFEQYRMCIQFKVMNEVFYSYLGMLVFREEIEIYFYKQVYRINSEVVG